MSRDKAKDEGRRQKGELLGFGELEGVEAAGFAADEDVVVGEGGGGEGEALVAGLVLFVEGVLFDDRAGGGIEEGERAVLGDGEKGLAVRGEGEAGEDGGFAGDGGFPERLAVFGNLHAGKCDQ